MLALGWGGNRYPWASAPILALFALSALFWAGFAWRTRVAEEPLIPLRIISLRIVRDATGSGATCSRNRRRSCGPSDRGVSRAWFWHSTTGSE